MSVPIRINSFALHCNSYRIALLIILQIDFNCTLIVVGFLMFSSVNKIDMDDLSEAIPAYIAIIAMPFCYSISEGISFGVISYTILNVLTRHTDRISALMYILTILFIGKYIML